MIGFLVAIHGIGWDLKNAVFQVLYDVFIKGPLYIVAGVGNAITYLTGSKLATDIFNINGDRFGMPRDFVIFLAIAMTLIVLFMSLLAIKASLSSQVKMELSGMVNRTVTSLIIIVLIPVIFFCANFLIVNLIQIVLGGDLSGQKLANQVGQLGFTDNKNHSNFNFQNTPTIDDHYNLFLGASGSFFCLVIFFILGIALIKRIFDLFLLYIISPVVFSTATSSQKWSKVNLWKDLTIARFVSSLGVVLALNLFLTLEPRLFEAGRAIGNNWFTHTAFALLFICGGAIAVLQSQTIFSNLVGATVGIQDGMAMLTTVKSAGLGTKAGALGMLGVGKGILMGRNRQRFNQNLSIGDSLKANASGGLAGQGGSHRKIGGVLGVSRATTAGVLAGAGFVAGAITSGRSQGWKNTAQLGVKSVGRGVAVAPKKLAKAVATPYQKGHAVHKTLHTTDNKFTAKQKQKKN